MNTKLLSYYQKKLISWEGWIESGIKKHKMTVGDLKIDLDGTVSGEGSDFVGRYIIRGAAGPRLLSLCQEMLPQDVFLRTESSGSTKRSKELLHQIDGWTGDLVYFRKIYDETRAIEYSGQMIANQLKGKWSLIGNPSQQGQFCIYMTAKEWNIYIYPAGSTITHPATISTVSFISADDHGLVSIGCERESGIFIKVGLFEVLQKDCSICKQYVGTDNVNFFSGKFTTGNHQYHVRGSVQYPNFTISHFELKGYKIKEEYYPSMESQTDREGSNTDNQISTTRKSKQNSEHKTTIDPYLTNMSSDPVRHIEVKVPHSSSMDSQVNKASSHQSSAARAAMLQDPKQSVSSQRPIYEPPTQQKPLPEVYQPNKQQQQPPQQSLGNNMNPYQTGGNQKSSVEIQTEINNFQISSNRGKANVNSLREDTRQPSEAAVFVSLQGVPSSE